MLILISCSTKQPIKIGFAGNLTGDLAFAGTSARNGMVLAVEEVNEKGGINGRLIELVIKDDKGDPETALRVDQELINENVTAIIGPITSTVSLAIASFITEKKIVTLSPTSSTPRLYGIDDYFFNCGTSLTYSSVELARLTAEYAAAKKVAVLYSRINQGYTNTYTESYTTALKEQDIATVAVNSFLKDDEHSYIEPVKKTIAAQPDAVAIVGGALEIAMICQQLYKLDYRVPIFINTHSDKIIDHGGKSVEGVITTLGFYPDNPDPGFQEFKKKYNNRFGSEPNFASEYAYDTTNILIDALGRNSNKDQLKETLLSKNEYYGVSGKLVMNQSGDINRKHTALKIINGKFKIME